MCFVGDIEREWPPSATVDEPFVHKEGDGRKERKKRWQKEKMEKGITYFYDGEYGGQRDTEDENKEEKPVERHMALRIERGEED